MDEKLVESGYAIRRTDRDFELASVKRILRLMRDQELEVIQKRAFNAQVFLPFAFAALDRVRAVANPPRRPASRIFSGSRDFAAPVPRRP
jgi:hypothetical protein